MFLGAERLSRSGHSMSAVFDLDLRVPQDILLKRPKNHLGSPIFVVCTTDPGQSQPRWTRQPIDLLSYYIH